MTFFDRKEEVINIELTQYGKFLLSKGKFKPAYYEFFDDDIIYDSNYASVSGELQKEIQTRIKEVPRTHVQYNFVSSEEEVKKQLEQLRSNKKGSFSDVYIPYNLKHRIMSSPLSKADIGSQNAPAWNIRSFRNAFEQTNTYVTGNYSNSKTPLLRLTDIEYKITVEKETQNVGALLNSNDLTAKQKLDIISDFNNFSTRFQDNTYLRVEQNYILLDLQELNTQFTNDNFEIQIYEIEQNEDGKETLAQLYFPKIQEDVVNNILVDEVSEESIDLATKTEIVTNYFNILTDKNISSNIMCANLSDDEKIVLNTTNQLNLQCEERYVSFGSPRIISDVTSDDLGDKC